MKEPDLDLEQYTVCSKHYFQMGGALLGHIQSVYWEQSCLEERLLPLLWAFLGSVHEP